MPSPVGHALGGLIVGCLSGSLPAGPGKSSRGPSVGALTTRYAADNLRVALSWPAIGAVLACLPDIDFLWGRHAMETHSLGAAAAVGVLVWAITRRPAPALACAAA